jgi:hypothetical protein
MSPTQTTNSAPRIGPMPGMATENPSLGTGEKTLPDLLIDALDAPLEGEHLRSELRNDARGYLLCRQSNAVGAGCAKCFARYFIGPFDGAVYHHLHRLLAAFCPWSTPPRAPHGAN